MMLGSVRIEEYISSDLIIPYLKATDKRDVLQEMVSNISEKITDVEADLLLESLLAREKLGTTGVGYGVAIPHARVKGLLHTVVSFARSIEGIDFQSIDENPVYLFFLILAPEDATTTHLKVLSRISMILKDQGVRSRLRKVSDSEEILSVIVSADRKI